MTGIQQQNPQDYQSLLAQQLMQAGPQEQIYSPMQGFGELISALMGAYLMNKKNKLQPTNTAAMAIHPNSQNLSPIDTNMTPIAPPISPVQYP